MNYVAVDQQDTESGSAAFHGGKPYDTAKAPDWRKGWLDEDDKATEAKIAEARAEKARALEERWGPSIREFANEVIEKQLLEAGRRAAKILDSEVTTNEAAGAPTPARKSPLTGREQC